ncbi:MAG: DUF58 domain-containing protein [Candidatus Hodarchaeales archaeon]
MDIGEREFGKDGEVALKRPSDIHLTNRFSGIVFLFFTLIFVIIFFKAGTLIGLLLPVILLLFITRQYTDVKAIGTVIKVSRELSRLRVVEGDEIEIFFHVKNKSNFSTHTIELQDLIAQEFEIINGSNIFTFNLYPKEEITLKYTIRCHYIGKHAFNLIHLRHRDFLRMSVNDFYLSGPDLSASLAVIPKLEKIEKLPIMTEWMRLYSGFFATKYLGDDLDFRGIREFTYGDTIRRVNWKTTARFQAVQKRPLYSNLHNWDRAMDIELILDTTYSVYPIWAESLRAITSLAEFLLRNRNRVGLTIVNQFPEYIKPRIGKKQLKEITEKLLMVEPEKIANSDMLQIRMEVVTRYYDPKALILVISPFLDNFVVKSIVHLRKLDLKVVAITPMALNKQLNEIKYASDRDYAIETPIIHELVSSNLILDQIKIRNVLKNNKIHQIEWFTTTNLSTTLFHTRKPRKWI